MYISNHPCQKDCPDRTPICQATCKKLKEYRETTRAKKYEQKRKDYEVDCYQIPQVIKKSQKNKRRK